MGWMNVPSTRAPLAIIVFTILFVVSLVVVLLSDGEHTILVVWSGLEGLVVVNAAFTYIIIEGGAMLAEVFLKAREQKGREEERAMIINGLTPEQLKQLEEWLGRKLKD